MQNLVARPRLVASRPVISNWPTAHGRNLRFFASFQGLGRPSIQSNQKLKVLMGKRKSHSSVAHAPPDSTRPALFPQPNDEPPAKRRASQRNASKPKPVPVLADPEKNADVLDGAEAWRASPDADEQDERMRVEKVGINAAEQIKQEDGGLSSLTNGNNSDSTLSDLSDIESPIKTGTKHPKKDIESPAEGTSTRGKSAKKVSSHTAGSKDEASKAPQFLDPEADGEEEPDEEELQAALSRPPPVNSNYLPLPWKGRLGYVCCQVFSILICS